MTISEGLGWLKTLQARHAELVALRNQNSAVHTTRYGADREQIITPTYDVKKLDKRVSLLAREVRLLDEAVKRANATTELTGFTRDDAVLGELEE